MQSRFIFLEDDFPKLADYGKKAENCSGSDNNICLLNLGRMAEFIARELCVKNNIPVEAITENLARKLLDSGIITEEISRKITALTEIKHDAANDGYDSEMACSRLMDTAEELCRWFMSYNGGGKFAFLADLFPENCPAPPLACLAEYGREAERNLSTNTRYSFICLGDIGEAVTDILLERDGIRPDKNTAQHERINMLFNIVGMSNKDKIDILHHLRQTRNDAVHKRYESSEEGRQLIGEALELCKWLFMFVMSEGDFVRGVITESGNDGLGVMVGEIPASVPASEIPEDKAGDISGSYIVGERHIFRAKFNDGQRITLTMSQANADPWTNTARRYSRYVEGQLLNARITAITENFGMSAEIGDDYEVLEARIPESEYSLTKKYKAGDTVRASVKWLNPKEYPYIILSIRDAEENSKPDKWAGYDDSHERKKRNEAMSDKDFRAFCKSARYEEILAALDEGANYDAKNSNGVTALMTAAQHNKDSRVVKALVEAGADIHAKDNDGKTAADYALKNPNLEGTEILSRLLEGNMPGDSVDDVNDDTENFTHDSENEALQENKADITQSETLPEDSHDDSQPETLTEIFTQDSQNEVLPENQSDITQSETLPEDSHDDSQSETLTEIFMHDSENEVLLENQADITQSETLPENSHDDSQSETLTEIFTGDSENEALPENKSDITQSETWPEDSHDEAENETLTEFLTGESQNETMSQDSHDDSQPETMPEESHYAPQNEHEDYSDNEKESYEIEAPETHGHDDNNDRPLTQEQEEESRQVLRMTMQKDFLKICRSGSEDDITQAVNAGVNVNVTNRTASTALMFAAQSNTAGAIDILIHAGANVNAQDDNGNTALIYAASYNTDDVVDVLINAGADSEITNNTGHKASDYARHNYKLADTDIISRL